MTKRDTFFSQLNCDRCNSALIQGPRQMSWFTEDCLCSKCVDKEKELRGRLEFKGIDVGELEGCGYVPELKY